MISPNLGEDWTKTSPVIGTRKLSTPMENLLFKQVSLPHMDIVSRLLPIDNEHDCLEDFVRRVNCARRPSPSSPKSFEPGCWREYTEGIAPLCRPPHLNSQLIACGL